MDLLQKGKGSCWWVVRKHVFYALRGRSINVSGKIRTRSSLCFKVEAAGDNWSNIQVHVIRKIWFKVMQLRLQLIKLSVVTLMHDMRPSL